MSNMVGEKSMIGYMKFGWVAMLCIGTIWSYAQSEINIQTQRIGNEVIILADNAAVVPMTADLTLELTNMKTDFGDSKGTFVIPPKSTRYELARATPTIRNGRTGISLESQIYLGDAFKSTDKNHLYQLPFEKGKSYYIAQGYNGKFSHRGVNALDFSLDLGEKVYAARGGIVYEIEEKNKKSCAHSSCQQYNNFITIYHPDGTFAEYSHLDHNGVKVKVGDLVNAGDFIGYSGNTGWSSGPHLHFVVYRYTKGGKRETIKTRFRTKEKDGVYLREKERYIK